MKIIIVLLVCFVGCDFQSTKNISSDEPDTLTHRMWYKECSVNLGYRINMINTDFGLAISRGKGDIQGLVLIYKNHQWNSFTSFDYSDYPAICYLTDSSFIYLIHETHSGNYKPRLYKVENGKETEIILPPIMWDERDYNMWKGISISETKNIWLAGQKGNLIYSSGALWHKVNVQFGNNNQDHFLSDDINDIYMISDSLGWAACRNGSILKYENTKWSIICRLTDQPLNRIVMFDDRTGWAVGDKGTVLKCAEGKWNLVDIPSRASLYSVKMIDPRNVWIVGTHSTLLKLKEDEFIPEKSIKIFTDTFLDVEAVKDTTGNFRVWIIGNEGIYTQSERFSFSFTDITAQSALTRDGMCGIFYNENNDDYIDLLIMTEEGPNLLFNNSQEFIFSEIPRKSSLVKYLGIANTILTGDFNNDGDNDILEVLDNSDFQLSLGIGGSDFIDWSPMSGINLSYLNTRSQFFSTNTADFNNDGNLDIYITNFNDNDFLLINDGTGKFENVWENSGINKQLNQECMGAVFSDFNNDNLIDVLLVYRLGENSQDVDLFLNDGGLLFKRKTVPAFFSNYSEVTMSAIAEDLNNDGNIDIVIYNNESPLKILLNNGQAEFSDNSAECGFTFPISHTEPSHGLLSAADVNNDGWIDIFTGSRLFLNSPELKFEDITNYSGIYFKGNSTFSDIDLDGDFDLYIGSSRTALGEGHRSVLFRNNLLGGSFVKIKLYPDFSNRNGIGTRVQLSGFDSSGNLITNTVQFCGLGANPLTQKDYSSIQFALVDSLTYKIEVQFPSGEKKTVTNIIPKGTVSVYESSTPVHQITLLTKSFLRTFRIMDFGYEILRLSILVLSLFILFRIGKRSKSYRIITKWYFQIFIFLLYILLIHFSLLHGVLHSFIVTLLPINLFLYVFLFTAHRIIEIRESKIISHFKIIDTLGAGGIGKVYKAVDINNALVVALKVLKPEIIHDDKNREMMLNEGKTLLKFNHPNIIKVFEIGTTDEHTFIAMEYLEGGTLHDFVAENFPINSGKFIKIATDICYGLEVVHANHIIHRDLKTQNIMFDNEGNIKIMDFGLSKSPLYGSMSTREGAVGTLGFMSPEQVTGNNIDHRADIFSLGIILYYMATNSFPFTGENEIALIHSIFNHVPVAPASINKSIPVNIDSVILKCLEKNVSARYNNIREIICELEK